MLRKGFEASYDNLQVLGAEQLDRPKSAEPVVRVRFQYQDRYYEAFAYGTITTSCDGTKQASLINIPGSGLNQSLGIATGDKKLSLGVLQALSAGGKIIYIYFYQAQ